MEEILKAVASGLKLDAEQFIADFKNGDDLMTEKEIAAKLASFIPEKVKAANETAKKVGRSEMSKRYSRIIKDSGFENSENLEGEALLTAYLEWKGGQAGDTYEGDLKTMSRDELLKLPAVKSIVKEVREQEKVAFAPKEKEYAERLAKLNELQTNVLLEKWVLDLSQKEKAHLGEDPEVRKFRIASVIAALPKKREVDETGALKFIGDDGFERTDAEDIFKKAVNALGFVQKQDPNKGGAGANGSGTPGGGGQQKYTPIHTFPNGAADFEAKLKATMGDFKTQAEIRKDYAFHQQQNEAAGSK